MIKVIPGGRIDGNFIPFRRMFMIQKKSTVSPALKEEWSPRDFSSVRGLKNLPDPLIEAHLKLYAGYVANTNLLRKFLRDQDPGTPTFAEFHRRLGYELNGLLLHELYFEEFLPGGQAPGSDLKALFRAAGLDRETWEKEFLAMGKMRGVGWVILYQDPNSRHLSNHWISLHQDGHPAGYRPILALDVWEHAFSGMDRAKYLEAFLANLDWEVVERRLR
jgi:Fe-Mn family superoxide dismutase